MRVPIRSLTSTLAASLLLCAGACGDDGGGSNVDTDAGTSPGTTGGMDDGNDDALPTTNDPTNTTNVDTTGGPPDPTGLDTTGDSADDTTTGEPGGEAAFRFNSLNLIDPHLYAAGGAIPVINQVNDSFNEGLNTDDPKDKDDFLDLGLALVFRPLDQADGATNDIDFANADCVAPDGTECGLQVGSALFPSTYTNSAAGPCLEADPTHLSDDHDPQGPTGPCFTVAATNIELVTSSVTIPLADAEVSAQYVGDPAGNLASGLVRGFITNEVAENTMVTTDLLSGPLSDFLRDQDRDDGDTGWWFYLEFTAIPMTWTDA